MIRPCDPGDVAAVARMLADFDAAAGVAVDRPGEGFSLAHARAGVGAIAAHRLGLVLVLDLAGAVSGVLIAQAGPTLFRPGLWADELAFWIDPPARGAWAAPMLRAYETWAAGLGARVVGLSALDERAARMFRRRGYAAAEVKLKKVL